MKSEEALDRYAQLIVSHGLNVQPGQVVNIATETIHRDLAMRITEQCYARGAKLVTHEFTDARDVRLRILGSDEKDLSYVPKHITAKADELVDDQAANLKIIGSEDPDLLSDLPPEKLNTLLLHRRLALKRFYDEGIGNSKVQWCVVAAATPKWGKKVFPELSEADAGEQLWQEIFSICRADREDCLEYWKKHNATLQSRAKRLTEMKIREIRFTGPGTDLTVGISERAIFKGGQEISGRGHPFEPNLPTEEVFTTPDFRKTNGTVRATRPFMINGRLIEGLSLEFKDGAITGFDATQGADTFEAYIDSDEGGRRLGEVALVGIDSPIYQSGKIFEEILFDENAACHIAVGFAYKFCLEGGATMTAEEAAELGCNESSVHTDMMVSSEEVDVVATTYAGEQTTLIAKGKWTIG